MRITIFFVFVFTTAVIFVEAIPNQIDAGASTSRDKNKLSDKEKRKIKFYFKKYATSFITDNKFDVEKYENYNKLKTLERYDIQEYLYKKEKKNEDEVLKFLSYGQHPVSKEKCKLPNYKERNNYYDSISKTFKESCQKNEDCQDFKKRWKKCLKIINTKPKNKSWVKRVFNLKNKKSQNNQLLSDQVKMR